MLNVERMDSIPPNSNPFHYDSFNMGTRLGSNVMVMHANHSSEECKYLIIVLDNGERYRVALKEEGIKPSVVERIMNVYAYYVDKYPELRRK